MVYKWFDRLNEQGYGTIAYVIMPNHLHAILYISNAGFNLNTIIGNAKRFMAYEIIKRLEQADEQNLLNYLSGDLTEREKRKVQLHKVFTDSFDAKGIFNEKFFNQKLNYIHQNPVSGKWRLATDYTEYSHSSASFYETGKVKHYASFDYRLL